MHISGIDRQRQSYILSHFTWNNLLNCFYLFYYFYLFLESASTNDLKICRISRCIGKAKGGDDVFIFVEKVNRSECHLFFIVVMFSFTLYPALSKAGRGYLVLRHSIAHALPNFQFIACLVVELIALVRVTKKRKLN